MALAPIFKKLEIPTAFLVRVVFGALFSFHGIQKIFGVLTDHQPPVGSQLWIGGLIELVCGIGIAVGAGTRACAFLASGTMAVAYTQFHWKLRGGSLILPAVNNGELAVLYCFVFLWIFAHGAGPWRVDALVRRSRG